MTTVTPMGTLDDGLYEKMLVKHVFYNRHHLIDATFWRNKKDPGVWMFTVKSYGQTLETGKKWRNNYIVYVRNSKEYKQMVNNFIRDRNGWHHPQNSHPLASWGFLSEIKIKTVYVIHPATSNHRESDNVYHTTPLHKYCNFGANAS